ncbi:MAG: HDIG domain-containing metalloprotein [Myxococcota bacterium]|nr:HDIG domain-containing metalloprotein [Myxococcota bacterium]
MATVLVVSAAFATLMVFVNRAETFVEPSRVQPGDPAPVTLRIPWTRLMRTGDDSSSIHLEARAPIVARGETVSEPELASLVRAYEDGRRPPDGADLLGLWFVYFLIAMMLTAYLRGLSPGRGALLRTQLGLMALALALLLAAKVFLLLTPFPAHVVPVAAMSLWAALFLDRRTALMVGLAMAFLAASLVAFRLAVAAVYLATSITAVLVLGDKKNNARIVQSGVAAAVAGAGVYVAARVIFDGGFDLGAELRAPAESALLASIVGGLLSGVVAWAASGLAVMVLGAVSRAKLVELSDLDQPLLKKIAKEAPGSWEHSRAMANLAEAAANAIGADALLTRVGAYYHDLGKSCQAKYFVENLQPGEPTPHREIPPDLSADAIMAHVVEGVNILRRGGIPEPVVEFAYTHHGTSVIEYFWHKTLEQGNPRERDESFFRYPGMRPRTKETAILMLVDSIEAASRTIDPPERDKFEEMVQRIIFVKLRQGQLDESGLTLQELRTIANQVVDSLCSIYHSRIKYPWQEKKNDGTEGGLPLPGSATEEEVAKARAEADAREAESRDESADEPELSPGSQPPEPRPEAP